MSARNPDITELSDRDVLRAGERTGPGREGVACPACGAAYRLLLAAGALFRCPCGRLFTPEELARDGGAAAPAAGAATVAPAAPPTRASALPPEAAAFRDQLAFSTRADASATVDGSAAPATFAPAPGAKTRFGKYEILEEVARGGMGVVYRARQEGLNREVALKMLLAGEGAGEEQIRRFLREAESAAKLSHPGIVPIYDVGEEGGRHYYTMEFIRGDSVAQVLDRMGMIPPRQALRIGLETARALHYAHENGILHRDIKPANIMLSPREEKATEEFRPGESVAFHSGLTGSFRVLVADFGLAKDMSGGSVLTLSGTALGTPVYMSPEQADGDHRAMGPASDVYSLGAVLYEMVTGEEPFQGTSVGQVLAQVVTKDPVPPRRRLPGLHRDVETVILTAMAKEPNRRYPTAQAMADDIERYLKGEAIGARPASLAYRVGKRIRRNKLVTALAALVLLVAAGGLAALDHSARAARQEVLDQALARVAEGEAILEAAATLDPADAAVKALEAERAFGEALGLAPGLAAGEDGARRAKLARLFAQTRDLLEDGNFKAAGFVLQEARVLAPEDPEGLRLFRIQQGTSTLGVVSTERGLTAYFAPTRRGVVLLPEILPPLDAAAAAGLVERLGDLPFGPADRPYGDGELVLGRDGRARDSFRVAIPRSADARVDRRILKVDEWGEAEFDSIAKALEAAGPGSVIEVAAGTYSGPVTVTVPGLRLEAAPGGRVVLKNPGKGPALTAENAPGFRMEGFKILAGEGGGVLLRNCPGAVLLDNAFSGGKETQGTLEGCHGALVAGNVFADALEPGLCLAHCEDAVVADNHIHHVGWVGIYIAGGSHRLLAARNLVHDTQRMGIFTHVTNDVVILENAVFRNPQWGIIVGEQTANARVEGNFVHDTVFPGGGQMGTGIAFRNAGGAGACLHNTVFRCTAGLEISQSHGTRCFDNIVFDCVLGGHWQSCGKVDYNCLWNNRIFGQWVEQQVRDLREMQEVFSWRDEKMAHGQEGDPRFVSPATGDFALGPASPCRGAASDGGDLGAPWDAVRSVIERSFDRAAWLKALDARRLAALAAGAADPAEKRSFLLQALLFAPGDADLKARLAALGED